jgi:hypothetical protein
MTWRTLTGKTREVPWFTVIGSGDCGVRSWLGACNHHPPKLRGRLTALRRPPSGPARTPTACPETPGRPSRRNSRRLNTGACRRGGRARTTPPRSPGEARAGGALRVGPRRLLAHSRDGDWVRQSHEQPHLLPARPHHHRGAARENYLPSTSRSRGVREPPGRLIAADSATPR